MVDKTLIEEKKAKLISQDNFTVNELAELLDIPRVTIQSWINRGLFSNARKRSGRWEIPTEDIITFDPPNYRKKVEIPYIDENNDIDVNILKRVFVYGYLGDRNKEIYEHIERHDMSTEEMQEHYKLTRSRLYQIHDKYKEYLEQSKALQERENHE